MLSDFQSGRLANENDISDLSKLLNDKIRLYTFNYSGKDVYNIGISNLTVESQIFEKNKPVDFNVTVTNYSKQLVKNLVVSLFVNGKRSVQQSINLNPGESKTTSFEAVINSKGFADVFAEIEDDDINQDNKRYTNVFIPGEIPVIIFTDNPDDSKFVKLALSADENNSIKVTERNLNQISSINLNDYDAVFVIGSQNISNVDRLKSYLNSGGGLFLMPGSNSNANQFGNLLNQLGLPKPQGEVNETNQNGNSVSFSKVEFDHPIFNDLFLKKDENKKIESPDIFRYLKINTEGKGKNIISLVDGSSFLSEFKINSGKVFLLSVSPVLSWSNFPLKSIFVPIINKSVYYFSSKDRGQVNYIAGDEVTVNISNRTNPQIKIVQPNKTEVFINLEKNSANNYINFNQTSLSGNYDVYSGNNILTEFAVNTDPLESVTKYLTEKKFADYLKKINFKGIHITIKKDENPSQIISQARFGSELWKYFVLIALILALIEMTIARNAKKEMVDVSSK